MAQVTLTAEDGREVAEVMSRLGPVCEAFEAELDKRPSGRPRDWTVAGTVAALLLLARHAPKFHISHIEALIGTLSPQQLKRLQLQRSDGTPFTTRQISYAWNEITRAVDPAMPGLTRAERIRRDKLLRRLGNKMLMATIPAYVRREWQGHLALDATLVWAHGRPPGEGKNKLYVSGRDGDGTPGYLSDVERNEYDEETSDHPYLWNLEPNLPAPEAFHSNGRRRRRDRGRRSVGARWIGNERNWSKRVFGHAFHTAVMCGAEDAGLDSVPLMAVGNVTTPTTANPAATGRLLVEDIHQLNDGHIGDVLADGGYSQARAEHWQLPIRALGGEPIFRLHGTNQEGHKGAIRHGQYLKIDGRLYCACLPDRLRSATYPHRPTRDRSYNRQRKADYNLINEARRPYELRYRTTTRTGMRFSTPHHGLGCTNCSNSDRQCCDKRLISIPWDELGNYQRHQFGSAQWEASYSRRSRIEGYFGNIKNSMVGGHVRDTAQFFEFAKISFAFIFNAMATNLARLKDWKARHATLDTDATRRPRRGRRRLNHTLDEIRENPDLVQQKKARKRRMKPPKPKRTTSDPLAFLGTAPT